MAYRRLDRARVATATTGTGTITLGTAVGDASRGYYQSFAAAGIADGDQVDYLIIDGSAWEIGTGTYTASGTTLSRTLIASSTGSLLNLTGSADVSIAPSSDDWAMIANKASDVASAGTVTLGSGFYFHITGTTGITDIDFAKPWDGRMVVLIFDGALTLTHNGTTLKLPGGVNITTVAGDRGIFIQDSGDNIICLAYIRANGNKDVRVFSEASSATSTPNADLYDQHNVTALAAADAFAAPTGTPIDGQSLIIRIKDNGTARALSWNSIYRALGITLPTTTVINKTLYVGFKYNAADSKWDGTAIMQEA